MKFQPKRFVVELKRGTNRAAFASPDAAADRFSDAEAMLFGAAQKVKPEFPPPKMEDVGPPGGRILRSLVEPPAPVIEDAAPPARRGRKPGSKNKPKPQPATVPPSGTESAAERPRRGRKPGSKNKPKVQAPAASFPAAATGWDGLGDATRPYDFADEGGPWEDAAPSGAREPDALPAAPPSPADGPRPVGRPRLRDRSTILKRYVLDVEPGPGQPGALKARRLARAAR